MNVRECFSPGKPVLITSESPSQPLGTFFEDEGDTGYFYALTLPEHHIVDAVHIYNVRSVVDRDRKSEVEILWSSDGFKSALLINNYVHAVFDFCAKRGYCRTDFPNFPNNQDDDWRKDTHRWDDVVMDYFEL